MKVGIYLRNYKLTEGGAALLVDTLKQELKDIGSYKFEFVTIYNGSAFEPYKKKTDNGEYINLTQARIRYIIPAKLYDLRLVPRKILFHILCRKGNGQTSSIWDMMCKKEKIDILWFTHPVQERTSVPYIFTVWDLGHRVLPAFPEMMGGINDWNERENVYQEMIYRATRVLTANEQGKKEILENYPIPENKIRIVPFPLSNICEIEESMPGFNLPESFFLYPAQFWPHKNHIRIIKALEILRDKYSIIVNVVFTGADSATCRYIREEVSRRNLDAQITFAGLVKSSELKYMYLKSKGIIYASLLGPNNIPPYEAVFFEKPVIISEISGHKEQMGDAALYFDPYSADELADCIMEILTDKALVEELKLAAEKLRDELLRYDYTETMISILDELYEMKICWSS